MSANAMVPPMVATGQGLVIRPGDLKLTAPKTSAGITRKPTTVVNSITAICGRSISERKRVVKPA